MEKKHFGELSNLLMGIKGETIGKPGDQGSVYPPWEGLNTTPVKMFILKLDCRQSLVKIPQLCLSLRSSELFC